MPNPNAALGRPDLAILLEEFDLEMDRAGFVGLKLFPRFRDVDRVAANAERIKLASLLEIRNTARNSDGTYGQTEYEFDQWNYQCQENGIEMPVDDVRRKIFANYFDAEVVATELCRDAVLRNHEKRIAAAVFNTGTFATAVTIVNDAITVTGNTFQAGKSTSASNTPWTNPADATPIDDVIIAQEAVYLNSGLWPDTIVLSRKLFKRLRQCIQIIDRIKFVKDPNTMSASDVAQALDIKNVLVAGGSKNTADRGQTAAVDQIWDKTMAMVCKVPEKLTSPWDPGISRTFY